MQMKREYCFNLQYSDWLSRALRMVPFSAQSEFSHNHKGQRF